MANYDTNTNGNHIVKNLAFMLDSKLMNGAPVTYLVTAKQINDQAGHFVQLDGYVYAKPYRYGQRWIWGRKNGALIREKPEEGEKKGKGRAWIRNWWNKTAGYELALAVEEAFGGKRQTLTPDDVAAMRGFAKAKPSLTSTVQPKPQAVAAPALNDTDVAPSEEPEGVNVVPVEPEPSQPKVELPPITEDDKQAVEDDLAIGGSEENPLDRLQAGDPKLLMELGATPGHAVQWGRQIRSGAVVLNGIEDIGLIRGVGAKYAANMISNWHNKFEK